MEADIKIRTRLPEESEFTEFIYNGNVEIDGSRVKVSYKEDDQTGLDNSLTEVTLTENKMIMERKGDFKSQMEFSKNRKVNSIYTTPYGEMEIESDTKFYTLERTREDLIRVHSEYVMTVAGEEQGLTVFYMEVEIK